jgi:hypothetical protein
MGRPYFRRKGDFDMRPSFAGPLRGPQDDLDTGLTQAGTGIELETT